jgi:hypothetical protein
MQSLDPLAAIASQGYKSVFFGGGCRSFAFKYKKLSSTANSFTITSYDLCRVSSLRMKLFVYFSLANKNSKTAFPCKLLTPHWRAIYNQRITRFTVPILKNDYSQFLLHAFELQKTIRGGIFWRFAPVLKSLQFCFFAFMQSLCKHTKLRFLPLLLFVIPFVLRFEAAVINLMRTCDNANFLCLIDSSLLLELYAREHS